MDARLHKVAMIGRGHKVEGLTYIQELMPPHRVGP